jgi:hypothetical protein
LNWLFGLGLGRSALLISGLSLLGRLRCASVLRMLGFVVLLLSDFLGVCDVPWVSHQLIDGFQCLAGRIYRAKLLINMTV